MFKKLKRILELYKNYSIGNYHVTDGPVISGVQTFVSDELVHHYTGLIGPNMIVLDGLVMVNSPLLAKPLKYIETLIAHEVAHIELNHVDIVRKTGISQTTYRHQVDFGFGIGHQVELEADAHAFNRGFDMREFLKDQHGFGIRKRIKALNKLAGE